MVQRSVAKSFTNGIDPKERKVESGDQELPIVGINGDNKTLQDVIKLLSPDESLQIISYLKYRHSNTNESPFHENLNDENFPTFLKNLNEYLFSGFQTTSKQASIDSYSNISFYLYLLSLKHEKDFFQDGDIYNMVNYELMFNSYINRIKNIDDLDSSEAETHIISFARLCGVLNVLGILSQNDNSKKHFISFIVKFLKRKIQELYEYLDERNYNNKNVKNQIDYILGLLPLNYSYIKYVKFDGEESGLDGLLDEYSGIFNDTLDGYKMCEKSEFSNDQNRAGFIKYVALTNLTHIVSLILIKTEGIKNKKAIFKNPKLQSILNNFLTFLKEVYNVEIDKIAKISNIDDIKKLCNSIIIDSYSSQANNVKFTFLENSYSLVDNSLRGGPNLSGKVFNFLSYVKKISSSILSGNSSYDEGIFLGDDYSKDFVDKIVEGSSITSSGKLELIYNFLLLNKNVGIDNLIKITNFIYSDTSSSNINFEIIRLRIFNLVLGRITSFNFQGIETIKPLLEKISSYIDNNKISSPLIFSYSILYISLGYCYSFFNDKNSQTLAKQYYSKFKQLNPGKDFDYEKSGINIRKFEVNIGWNEMASNCDETNCHNYTTKSGFTCPNSCKIYNEDKKENTARMAGLLSLNIFSSDYQASMISKALKELDNFIESKKGKIFELEQLNGVISRVFDSIFHGIAKINVVDISGNNSERFPPRNSLVKEVEITDSYKIEMTYPNIFSKYFDEFYKKVSSSDSINGDNSDVGNSIIGRIKSKLQSFLIEYNEKNKVRIELVKDFEDAIENNRIYLVFQGIYDREGNIVKYEILTRIRNPKPIDGRTYFIDNYIDAMNMSGRPDLLKWLISYIIEKSKHYKNVYKDLKFSVNLEYTDIMDKGIIELLVELARNGFDTSSITIENVEKGEWKEDPTDNLRILKDNGYKIALDDFGSESANFTRLLSLLDKNLLHYVKIDKELVKRLVSDKKDGNVDSPEGLNSDLRTVLADLSGISSKEVILRAIIEINSNLSNGSRFEIENNSLVMVQTINSSDKTNAIKEIIASIVKLCKLYKVKVVAEYVENEEVFNILKGLGVDLFQGYHLGKPKIIEELEPELVRK